MSRTYRVGRGNDCEIRLDDASISRLHAELSVTDDGRYYITDCNSSRGSFRFEGGDWVRMRQGFVKREDRLKLGNAELTVAQLIRALSPHGAS